MAVPVEPLECELELLPLPGGEVGLRFHLRNHGPEAVQLAYFEPLMAVDLRATGESGEIAIHRPASNPVSRPVSRTVGPGEAVVLETPIRLRFDPQAAPAGGADPQRWSLAHPPAVVALRAVLQLRDRTLSPPEVRWSPGAAR